MKLSKLNYFLILVAVVTSAENLIYFNISNLFQIIGYLVLIIIPLVLFIKSVYSQNIRILDSQISRIMYLIIQILLTFILVAQFTYLIDSLAWLITGNPAVITNISNFGVWFVGIIFLVCAINLGNKQTILKFTSVFLGIFNLVLIPFLLLFVITSLYGGLLHEQLIGHVDASFKQLIQLLPLLSILLIARSKPEEEQKIADMLLPAIAWMILIFGMTMYAITSLTTSDVVGSSNYLFDFFESLRKAQILNIYNYNFASLIALYKFMNSVLLIMILIIIKTTLYDKSFVYVCHSEYLLEEDAKNVFLIRRRRQTLLVFALIMAFVVPLSGSLYHLNTIVTRVATMAIIVLNMLTVSIMAYNILKNKHVTISTKILGVYTSISSIIVFILYFVL